MKRGTIKFFNQTKGFGFITQEDNSEIFFHISDVKCFPQDLRPDTIVSYGVGEGKNGKTKATEINLG